MQTLGWLLSRNWDSGDVSVPQQFTEGRELGHCRPCSVVQMVSMRAVLHTGHQRQREGAPLLEEVRESERTEAAYQ